MSESITLKFVVVITGLSLVFAGDDVIVIPISPITSFPSTLNCSSRNTPASAQNNP